MYEEELIHRSELPIGVLLTFFGFYPWILSNLFLGTFQIIGLAISFFGIILLLRAYVLHRLQLKQCSFRGLSRKTITSAIIFIDSKIFKQKELELPIPDYRTSTNSGSTARMHESKIAKFIKSTAGLIVWPSEFINEIKQDLEKMKKRIHFYSATLLVLFLISLSMTYNPFTSGELTLLFFFLCVPLAIFTFQGMFFYLRFIFEYSYFFKDNWASDILSSESIQLEETMIEILNRLQTEFQYPLRFYLGREYSHLVYTGRTKIIPTLGLLKEAVLYPQDILSKEEGTGAK